jgi:hypothetical protein
MKRLLLAAGAALCLSGAAHASIIPILLDVVPNGANFEFDYSAALSGDQGLVPGSEFVIFDFAGYVPGSVFSTAPNIVASVQNMANFNTNAGGVEMDPLFTDDPTIPDLVFTYTGPPFHTTGGPYSAIIFTGLGALSTSGNTTLDGFSSRAISNDGIGTSGQPSFNDGAVAVPFAGVPEPASWALLILGFGGVGSLLRARRRTVQSVA